MDKQVDDTVTVEVDREGFFSGPDRHSYLVKLK